MRVSDNELIVYRNETFSIDRTIVNKDGSPYIVSKDLRNPYLLITVSSSTFTQENTYKLSYFLSLEELPRFNNTLAINLKSLTNGNDEPRYSDWPELTPQIDEETEKPYIVECYYNGELVKIEPDDAVFYLEKDGVTEYKYFKITKVGETITGSWTDYSFRFIHTFNKSETSQWTGQTYQYSILLVAGQSTIEYLKDLCNTYDITYDSNAEKEELYQLLVNNNVSFDDDFDLEAPLALYDFTVLILAPTKLTVLSNLRGGMR